MLVGTLVQKKFLTHPESAVPPESTVAITWPWEKHKDSSPQARDQRISGNCWPRRLPLGKPQPRMDSVAWQRRWHGHSKRGKRIPQSAAEVFGRFLAAGSPQNYSTGNLCSLATQVAWTVNPPDLQPAPPAPAAVKPPAKPAVEKPKPTPESGRITLGGSKPGQDSEYNLHVVIDRRTAAVRQNLPQQVPASRQERRTRVG